MTKCDWKYIRATPSFGGPDFDEYRCQTCGYFIAVVSGTKPNSCPAEEHECTQ